MTIDDTIASQLTRLSDALDDQISALAEKGVTATGHGEEDIGDDIRSIEQESFFVVTVSWDSQELKWMPDCTITDIREAYADGKDIVVVADSNAVPGYVQVNGYYYYSTGDYFYIVAETDTLANIETKTEYQFNNLGVSETNIITTYFANDLDADPAEVPSGAKFVTDTGYETGTATRRSSSDLSVNGDTVTAPAGYYASSASESVASGTEGTPSASKGAVSNHSVDVTPSVTNSAGYIAGGTHTGSPVSVSASELDSGTKPISSNGNDIDVVGYAAVDVSVSPTVDDLSVTPSESAQTFRASGYNLDGFDEVNVSAVSADYVGSNIPRRYYADLSATGPTVSVPAGYYPNAVGKNVASGTAGTPTASKSAVSNHSVDVTPSVTNTSGYVTGSTKTGTPVTVTASELASGDKAITSNGNNIDIVGYETVSVNVPGGGSSKNVQVAAGVNRVNTTSYTAITGQSITVATTGTYDVYWTGYRSSTSGTNGTQLYIGDTAYGTAQTTFSNNGQSVHLTGVSLTKDQVITLRARARGTSYYMYGGNLTIVEQ